MPSSLKTFSLIAETIAAIVTRPAVKFQKGQFIPGDPDRCSIASKVVLTVYILQKMVSCKTTMKIIKKISQENTVLHILSLVQW